MFAERPRLRRQVRQSILSALRNPAAVLNLSPPELDLTLRLMRRARLLGPLAAQLQELRDQLHHEQTQDHRPEVVDEHVGLEAPRRTGFTLR